MEQSQPPFGAGQRFCSSCGAEIAARDNFCPGCGTAIGTAVDPWASAAPPLGEPMGFWIRVLAFLIDMLVVGLAQGVLAALLVPVSPVGGLVAVYLVSPLYFVLFTGFKGQTLGKMALGVRIVNVSGEAPGFWRAVLREIIGKLVSGVAMLLGYLWIGWDSHKRGWHDHIGGTYAVRAPGR